MALYTLLVLFLLVHHGGLDYAAWKADVRERAFRHRVVRVHAGAAVARVGRRAQHRDGLRQAVGVRLALQVAVIVLLIAYAGWTLRARPKGIGA